MRDNELGGFTLPNSIEVHAALRLAQTRGDNLLVKELGKFSWATVASRETAQLTKVVELEPEPSRELAFLLLDAITGRVEGAHPADIATATQMLASKGLLPGVEVESAS